MSTDFAATASTGAPGAVRELLALSRPGRPCAWASAAMSVGGRLSSAAQGRVASAAEAPAAQPGLLMDVASVTKVACTTVLCMRLVARGQLSLELPVRKIIPEFSGAGKDAVTVRDVLTHMAGLQPWWPLYCERRDRAGAAALAASLPLESPRQTRWQYSDLGFMLLGVVVERLLGMRLDAAFRCFVAGPLGLAAGFGPVSPKRALTGSDGDGWEFGMLASGKPYPVPFGPEDFAGWRTAPVRGQVADGNAAHAWEGVSGHAGLFASARDLVVLGEALRSGTFVPRTVLEQFASPCRCHPEQALGFRRLRAQLDGSPVTVLWHGGFTGTVFGFALEADVVFAAGLSRLCGTGASTLPSLSGPGPHGELIDSGAIRDTVLRAAGLAVPASAAKRGR